MALLRAELEIIYRDLEGQLYNFALRWVFNSTLAEELVHDAFLRIWNARDQVAPETIKSLLYKTIQNLALNEIRKRKVRLALASFLPFNDESISDNEAKLIQDQDLGALKVLLERLPLEYREVLLLSEFSNFSYREIAEHLGLAEGTVASRKSRALEILRKGFQTLEETT